VPTEMLTVHIPGAFIKHRASGIIVKTHVSIYEIGQVVS
jgi:hypothetical protein